MSQATIYLILFIAPILGGGLSLWFYQHFQSSLKWFLTFSGAYLFSITVLKLLPEAYSQTEYAGIFILMGFIVQLALEQLSMGVEHGHIHMESTFTKPVVSSIMIGLTLHAFLDGLPLGGHFHEPGAQQGFLYGVALHKIPVAFVLVTMLSHSTIKQRTIFILLIIFALISPLAAFIAHNSGLSHAQWASTFQNAMIAIVVGSFFHVSTTIIFETSTKHHTFNRRKIFAIFAGVILALLTYKVHA